jgi:hypothetical protein
MTETNINIDLPHPKICVSMIFRMLFLALENDKIEVKIGIKAYALETYFFLHLLLNLFPYVFQLDQEDLEKNRKLAVIFKDSKNRI